MATTQAVRPKQPSTRSSPRATTTTRTNAPSVSSQDIVDRRVAVGQTYFDDAKKYISDALFVDESGARMEALELYNKSLTLLRAGLASLHNSAREGLANTDWKDLKAKMEKMRDSIKSRMEVLLEQEIGERSKSNTSQTGSQTSQTSSVSSGNREETKADLLFNTDTGIALFAVDSREHVRRYEDVDAFSVFKYREPIEGQPPAFIQCGGFVYPLIKGSSPVLKSGDRMYMFPELRGDDGTVLGVVLDGATQEEVEQFDSLLEEFSSLKEQSETTAESGGQEVGVVSEEDSQWGTTVSKNIDRGVTWMSVKIAQGTEVAGQLITKGANKLRGKIDANEKPVEVPEAVLKGVHYTRKATGYVVGVSDYLMLSLAKLTLKVGKEATKAVANTEFAKNTEVNPHALEAWKVTKSGVIGAAAMFVDLERGAVAILKNVGQETSQTVGHKYGEDVGKVTDDSMTAVAHTANVAITYWSWKTWGIRFVGKVGEAITKESKETKEKLQNNETK